MRSHRWLYIGAYVVSFTETENTRNVDLGEGRVINPVLRYSIWELVLFYNKNGLAGSWIRH